MRANLRNYGPRREAAEPVAPGEAPEERRGEVDGGRPPSGDALGDGSRPGRCGANPQESPCAPWRAMHMGIGMRSWPGRPSQTCSEISSSLSMSPIMSATMMTVTFQ